MSFSQFKQIFQTTKQRYFPVMNGQGELCGIFSSTDVREVLFSSELGQLVVMKDIMVSNMITTTLSEDLNTVLLKLTKKNIDALPVVDEDNPRQFIGMIYRRDIIAYYNLHVTNIRESGG
jgi:CIC family chloride channel protein